MLNQLMCQSIEDERKLRRWNQNVMLHFSSQRYGQKKGGQQASFSFTEVSKHHALSSSAFVSEAASSDAGASSAGLFLFGSSLFRCRFFSRRFLAAGLLAAAFFGAAFFSSLASGSESPSICSFNAVKTSKSPKVLFSTLALTSSIMRVDPPPPPEVRDFLGASDLQVPPRMCGGDSQ